MARSCAQKRRSEPPETRSRSNAQCNPEPRSQRPWPLQRTVSPRLSQSSRTRSWSLPRQRRTADTSTACHHPGGPELVQPRRKACLPHASPDRVLSDTRQVRAHRPGRLLHPDGAYIPHIGPRSASNRPHIDPRLRPERPETHSRSIPH